MAEEQSGLSWKYQAPIPSLTSGQGLERGNQILKEGGKAGLARSWRRGGCLLTAGELLLVITVISISPCFP